MKAIFFLAPIAFASAIVSEYNLLPINMSYMSKSPEELKFFVDCLLDKGPCTPLYSTYRAIAQDSVQTNCKSCSTYQRQCYWMFLQGLKTLLPADYISYRQKYDPKNKYFDELESLLRNYSH